MNFYAVNHAPLSKQDECKEAADKPEIGFNAALKPDFLHKNVTLRSSKL